MNTKTALAFILLLLPLAISQGNPWDVYDNPGGGDPGIPENLCGNGELNPGEMCEQDAQCPIGHTCESCSCKAQWMETAVLAFLISLSLIAFIYLGGVFFGNPQLKTYSEDELIQLAFTGFTIISLAGFLLYIDGSLLPAIAQGNDFPEDATIQQYAVDTARAMQQDFNGYLGAYLGISEKLGEEGSKSGYCYLLNTGYSIVTCSGINALRSPVTNAVSSLSLALADISAELTLLLFAKNYAFTILLPFGIFLRTFNFTRKLGGILIAVAIGFYVVFPLMFLFSEKIIIGEFAQKLNEGSIEEHDEYLRYVSNAEMNGHSTIYDEFLLSSAAQCNPFSYDYKQVADLREGISGKWGDNELAIYKFEPVIFQVYIRAIFLTALNLTITLIFIQWLAAILGAQIDVSTLMRLSQ